MAIKKRAKPYFNIPNFGTYKHRRVKARWRKQRGIDSKKREKKAWAGAEPTIGYGNPESIRGLRASGKRLMVIGNINDLKTALGKPDIANYDIAIAHAVSKRKRIIMTELATQKKINVTNGMVAEKKTEMAKPKANANEQKKETAATSVKK